MKSGNVRPGRSPRSEWGNVLFIYGPLTLALLLGVLIPSLCVPKYYKVKQSGISPTSLPATAVASDAAADGS